MAVRFVFAYGHRQRPSDNAQIKPNTPTQGGTQWGVVASRRVWFPTPLGSLAPTSSSAARPQRSAHPACVAHCPSAACDGMQNELDPCRCKQRALYNRSFFLSFSQRVLNLLWVVARSKESLACSPWDTSTLAWPMEPRPLAPYPQLNRSIRSHATLVHGNCLLLCQVLKDFLAFRAWEASNSWQMAHQLLKRRTNQHQNLIWLKQPFCLQLGQPKQLGHVANPQRDASNPPLRAWQTQNRMECRS